MTPEGVDRSAHPCLGNPTLVNSTRWWFPHPLRPVLCPRTREEVRCVLEDSCNMFEGLGLTHSKDRRGLKI